MGKLMALGLIIVVGLVQIFKGNLQPAASSSTARFTIQTCDLCSRELRGSGAVGGLLHGPDADRGADRSGLPSGLLRLQRLELPQLRHRGGG